MSKNYPDLYFENIKQTIQQISEITRPIVEQSNTTLASVKPLVEEIKKTTAPTIELAQKMSESMYPVLEQMKRITESLSRIETPFSDVERNYLKSVAESLTIKTSALRSAIDIDMSGISELMSSLPDYKTMINSLNLDVNETFENDQFTNQEIADEVESIIKNKKFSISESWNSLQKKKWFIAIRIIITIVSIIAYPVIDRAKDDFFEAIGYNDFCEDHGVYQWIDSFFNLNENGTESEKIDQESEETSIIDSTTK